jgi:hypothetical protein
MLEAESRFRKVEGYRGLAGLAIKIEHDLPVTVNLTPTHHPGRPHPPSLCNHVPKGRRRQSNFHDARDNLTVAMARKLAILFWCMLTRREDYAHQQPSLTRKKLRRLEITAGAPKYVRCAPACGHQQHDAGGRTRTGTPSRDLLRAHGQRPARRRTGAEGGRERDPGARLELALEGQITRQATVELLTPAL